MTKFSANISLLFQEYEFIERFAAAKSAGFTAVEMQFPYDIAPDEIERARAASGLPIVVFNIPVGDMHDGGPGLIAVPGREAEFIDALSQAKDYARLLKPINVNCLCGYPEKFGYKREACLETVTANLRFAAQEMASVGVRVLVEAVNTHDRPGYLLTNTADTVAVLKAAAHDNLALEHDLYHMHVMEGRLLPTVERYLDEIGHIQFADYPGRHEPGTGEIDFQELFGAIEGLGYDGYFGAEYIPSTSRTEDSLSWLKC